MHCYEEMEYVEVAPSNNYVSGKYIIYVYAGWFIYGTDWEALCWFKPEQPFQDQEPPNPELLVPLPNDLDQWLYERTR